MFQVRLPDGSVREYEGSVTPRHIASEIGAGLAKAALAAEVNGKLVGLDFALPTEGDATLRILTKKDPESLSVMRHSCAHVMARAVMRLFEGVQLAFGPTVVGGFYYDFDLEHTLTEDDFPALEAEMAKIVQLNEPFERIEQPREKALQICRDLQQTYKVEHIEGGLREDPQLSFYRQGEFLDLCRGPHVPSAGSIGAFKLLSVAGAYWKGDQSRKQLQRLYGTAFFSKQDLEQHLQRIEEAKKRDHRVLGKQLELFTVSPLVGAGLVLWQPKGAIVRGVMESFVKDELRRRGYLPVYTPSIGRVELYETSGHYPYYADSMFAPIQMEARRALPAETDELPPPHHDLQGPAAQLPRTAAAARRIRHGPPLREIGRSLRHDPRPGLHARRCPYFLHGRTGGRRVSRVHRDDAACPAVRRLGSLPGAARFSRPGERQVRRRCGQLGPRQRALAEVCDELGMRYTVELGEAAFYGPKADFVVTDCLGREWQLGTVQLDYILPSEDRFALEYIGSDNQPHRPVMIHRAPLGSLERFIGVLIEHFAGAFPLWLAPEQARVVVVSQKFEEYGRRVEQQMTDAGLRVQGDYRPEKIGAKIRDAQLELVPYMFVIGQREADGGTVAVRDRLEGDLGAMRVEEAIQKLQEEIHRKTVRKTFAAEAAVGERAAENEY